MNTQISISENGTTTLATAGKYCDRNIDVNVNVPSVETELAEQKFITDSIIDRTITEYVNNTATSVGAYGFNRCEQLESIVLTKAEVIYGYAFDVCTKLKKVELPNLAGNKSSIYANAFRNCPLLEKFVIGRNEVSRMANINAFDNTGIAAGTGYIYVPDNLVESYKTATNWSIYASQIKPISELEE